MYGLYDKEGILRFVDSDKDACIAYAELFELGSTNYCLIDLAKPVSISPYAFYFLDPFLESFSISTS